MAGQLARFSGGYRVVILLGSQRAAAAYDSSESYMLSKVFGVAPPWDGALLKLFFESSVAALLISEGCPSTWTAVLRH